MIFLDNKEIKTNQAVSLGLKYALAEEASPIITSALPLAINLRENTFNPDLWRIKEIVKDQLYLLLSKNDFDPSDYPDDNLDNALSIGLKIHEMKTITDLTNIKK